MTCHRIIVVDDDDPMTGHAPCGSKCYFSCLPSSMLTILTTLFLLQFPVLSTVFMLHNCVYIYIYICTYDNVYSHSSEKKVKYLYGFNS